MRIAAIALLVVSAGGCADSGSLARPPDLALPEGDRIVRVQPGDCKADDCILADSRYESVTTVEGRSRSDEEVGRELATSLAASGWREAAPPAARYSSGQVTYPRRFTRSEGGRDVYLEFIPAFPGTYGLAYDDDGDGASDG